MQTIPNHLDEKYLLPLITANGGFTAANFMLGWKPVEKFETGIRKTVEWYLANPDWVAHVQSGAYREWVSKQYSAA
mgnify:CR=1 FL=1